MIIILEKRCIVLFKRNSHCDECNHPYKIVWNCKRNTFEKNWLYLCYNCIRLNKYLYGRYFKSQFQNIKSFRWCKLKLSRIVLPLYEVNV